jgi:hypothetical protein
MLLTSPDRGARQHKLDHPLHLLRPWKALGMPHRREWHPRHEVGVSCSTGGYHESGLVENRFLHVHAQVRWHQQKQALHFLLDHPDSTVRQPRNHDRSAHLM